MKLSLLTLNLGREWDIDKLIAVCRKYGYAGIEFRTGAGHRHGVEVDTPVHRLTEIRNRMEDGYVDASSIASGCRFALLDAKERRENVELAKRHVELAGRMDCGRIRVFGNEFQSGADKATQLGWVTESLQEIADFAKPWGVDVLLEMHGEFNYWKYAVKAVKAVEADNVGIVYNSDIRDMIGGSVAAVYGNVRRYIRHVHMHCYLRGYPYRELFRLLRADGYEGFLSAEMDETTTEPEKLSGYYAALYYAWQPTD